MIISNIYSDIPKELPNELFEKIIKNGSFKFERIILKGHSTPKGKWYDQMIVLNLPVSFSNPSSEEEQKRISWGRC